MNDQLKLLIELQEIDSSIIAINENIETYPRKLEKFKKPLKEAQEAFGKFKSQTEVFSKKKKDKDIVLDEIEDKINKLKARSSEIKTNKEYEAHLKEIQSFEDTKYKIEEEILSIMEELENFEGEIQKEKVKVTEAEEEYKKQEKILNDELEKNRAELESLKNKRREYVSKIDEELYDQYMKLLKRLGGQAVVETRNEVCLGCNTNIPPQLYNEIRETGEIYNCFYCKRFLYYKEPVKSEEPGQIPPAAS